MNCFEFSKNLSPYLDKSLPPEQSEPASQHERQCLPCRAKVKQCKDLLQILKTQNCSKVPQYIRKNPLASPLPKLEVARLSRSKWEQLPWYIRTTLEAGLMVTLVLMGITAGPKLRSIYEKSIEENLQDLTDAVHFTTSEPTEDEIPLARGIPLDPQSMANPDRAERALREGGDDFSTEEEGGDSEITDFSEPHPAVEAEASKPLSTPSVKVGRSEIWRFNIKTDSPHEVRAKIVKTLVQLGVDKKTPGMGGVEAPGGIQFDLILPTSLVAPLMEALKVLAAPISIPSQGLSAPDEATSPKLASTETFTWYKNKSRNPIEAGKAHVVIWLSLQ